jgi:hypothetical protein
MLKDGIAVAAVAGAVTFTCYWVCVSVLLTHVDSRLTLTLSEKFSGLAQVRDIFNGLENYTALHNPLGVDHVRFSPAPQTLEEVQDLERRGLPVLPYNLSQQASPSLLYQLMLVSWCSSGPPRASVLPALRTPGCRCIADAYLALVQETRPPNATNATIVYPPVDVRRRIGDRVYRCWDQRLVTRTTSCGRACTTHAAGLSLFANLVLFLCCAAFLLFRLVVADVLVLKAMVLVLGVIGAVPFLVQDLVPNSLNAAGIVACLFYLLVTLHKPLDMRGAATSKEGITGPHALVVCVMATLPLVLSAHTIQLGVAGYGRDVWAVVSFGITGGLLGAILQARLFSLTLCV